MIFAAKQNFLLFNNSFNAYTSSKLNNINYIIILLVIEKKKELTKLEIFSMIFSFIVLTIIERTLLKNINSYYEEKGLTEEEITKKIYIINMFILIVMIIACSFLTAANLNIISIITILAVLESFMELLLLTFIYK